MAFVLPQTQVFQEASGLPAEILMSMGPIIVGPQANLHRYSVASEKLGIALGAYNNAAPVEYPWPGAEADSIIDLSYVQLFFDDALLFYFEDPIGGSDTNSVPASYTNRVTTTNNGWASVPGFPRKSGLYDRDVQVGDILYLSDGMGNTQWTSVAGLIAATPSPTIGSATAGSSNTNTQGASHSDSQTGGTVNDVTLSTVTATAYNGLATGQVNETYTVNVTVGGAPGTAMMTVTSASGHDNVLTPFTPAAYGSATAIGARGLTATWTHTSNDFVAGQQWTINVAQAFTAATFASGGSYTGTPAQGNVTYIITVTLGGTFAGSPKPQITVTSTNGTDTSGPTNVTTSGGSVVVGSRGVTITFTGTELNAGDVYYIPVTYPAYTKISTLLTNNALSANIIAASALDVRLYIQDASLQIPQDQVVGSSSVVNWVATQAGITINAGIEAFNPTLTNGGVPFAVPVVSGPNTDMYAQYREWLPTYVSTINQISVPASSSVATIQAAVQAVLGVVDPDNPLAFGVFWCLQNANGNVIFYTAVADPTSVTDWNEVPPLLVGIKNIRSLVPLTTLSDVFPVYRQHVDTQSNDSGATLVSGEWRVLWWALAATTSTGIVDQATSSDGNLVLITIANNAATPSIHNTLVSITSANADLVSAGVLPNDILRTYFSVDGFGNVTYQEFVISSVLNADQLILAAGPSSPVSTPQKMEIWRNLTKQQSADLLAQQIEATADKRVNFVWPDLIDVGSNLEGGYFLCAALAGLAGAVLPQQSLQSVQVVGPTGTSRSTSFFSNAQLNTLATAGCVVVTTDPASGDIYVRNDNTSDQSSVQNGEEGAVRTQDAINYMFYNTVAPYFGQANVTPNTLTLIENDIITAVNIVQTTTLVERLGAMITQMTNLVVRADVLVPNVVIVQADVTYPLAAGEAQILVIFA